MKTKDIALAGVFIALTIVCAKIKIPFPVVPLTFQLVVVVASGIFLGPKLGAVSQAIYLLLGLIGLPVFADGGGIAYAIRPTFGFLLSFPLAAFLAGLLWPKSKASQYAAIPVAIFSSYIIGVPFLWLSLNTWALKDNPISFLTALSYGFWPFILKDLALGIVVFIVAKLTLNALQANNSSLRS